MNDDRAPAAEASMREEGIPKPGFLHQTSTAALEAETWYLVWSNEHKAWWGREWRGYTRIIANAGRYNRTDALRIAGTRGGGWFLNKGNPGEIAIPEADAVAQYARITAEQAALVMEKNDAE